MDKILVDVHTHTIASGHAYSTILENVNRASELGLSILGITEHGPSIPGAPDPLYFWNLYTVPRMINGVRLLLGSELNILDTEGNLDLNEKYYSRMDLRIAGIHSLCYTPGTPEECTEGMIAAIKNPWTHIISHPGDGVAPLIFEPIVLAAKESNTLLEINNSSLLPYRNKKHAVSNNLEILSLCKKYDVPVILGSDAHFAASIADYKYVYPLLEETEFPEELIMNDKPKEFLNYLNIPEEAPQFI